jgi:hypothetical protein
MMPSTCKSQYGGLVLIFTIGQVCEVIPKENLGVAQDISPWLP